MIENPVFLNPDLTAVQIMNVTACCKEAWNGGRNSLSVRIERLDDAVLDSLSLIQQFDPKYVKDNEMKKKICRILSKVIDTPTI